MRRSAVLLLIASASMGGCGGEEPGAPRLDAPRSVAGCLPGELDGPEGCVAAGVAPGACGAGFEPDGERGCTAILPPEPCGRGRIAVPGATECRPVSPCGEGKWGSANLGPEAQLVDGSFAGPAPDGSAERPWRTIGEAVAAAVPGGVIAIAAGAYDEEVEIAKPLSLQGRCPDLVEITAPSGALAAVIVLADHVELHDLSLTGSAIGAFVSGGEGVRLERVWVHDTASRGINAQDDFGPTELTISDALIEGASGVGIFAGRATARVERTAVRHTVPDETDGSGRGISVLSGELELTGSLVEQSRDIGVVVRGAASIEATLVRDTQPNEQGVDGFGLAVQGADDGTSRSSVAIRACVVERAHDAGVVVSGSDAEIAGLVVRDTQPRDSDQAFGRGLSIKASDFDGEPSEVSIGSSLFSGNRDVGLAVSGSHASIVSTLVRGTLPRASNGGDGIGIGVFADPDWETPTEAEISGSSIDGAYTVGLLVQDATARVDRTAVRGVRARESDGYFGDGVVVLATSEASATFVDSAVEASARAGLLSYGAALALMGSELSCNAIDLVGEHNGTLEAMLADEGENRCGCGDEMRACQVVSSRLEPPPFQP